jgi:hypothetical protein
MKREKELTQPGATLGVEKARLRVRRRGMTERTQSIVAESLESAHLICGFASSPATLRSRASMQMLSLSTNAKWE